MRERAYVLACADQLTVFSSNAEPAKKAPPSGGTGNTSSMAKSKEGPSER